LICQSEVISDAIDINSGVATVSLFNLHFFC
jgi:hypothetical protein